MKRYIMTLLLALGCLPFSVDAKTEQFRTGDEKVVTNKWSLLIGSAKTANQFLSDYQYSSPVAIGIKAEHGSFYRRSENVSWGLDLTYIACPSIKSLNFLAMANPANTNFWSTHNLSAEYGTYYNWNPIKNLYLRGGGEFELMSAMNHLSPDNINNAVERDLQLQLKMAAGIKYGWEFKNHSGLFFYGDVSVPFFGGFAASSKYQSFVSSTIKDFISPDIQNFFMSSFHNYQGIDTEIGVNVDFSTVSLSVSADINNRWWTANGLQNYRKFAMFKIGFCVDLISRPHVNNSRYF